VSQIAEAVRPAASNFDQLADPVDIANLAGNTMALFIVRRHVGKPPIAGAARGPTVGLRLVERTDVLTTVTAQKILESNQCAAELKIEGGRSVFQLPEDAVYSQWEPRPPSHWTKIA
jgi:hypothetical protein